MTENLKSCPFCGGLATVKIDPLGAKMKYGDTENAEEISLGREKK